MTKAQKQHIVIIGCGNVAWHLAKRFSELKNTQVYIYNHKENKLLKKFKTQLNCKVFSNLKEILAGADYYFICVADSFISSVSQKIKPFNKESVVLHTSGSISIDAIKIWCVLTITTCYCI